MPLPELNPDKALIFRITHKNNLPWILENGLHCRTSNNRDPQFVNIGLTDLIEKRHVQPVPVPPGGTVSDYVPFYFTPLSIMAFNIYTGRNVQKRANGEIIILVTSLRKLSRDNIPFLFTDRHASALVPRATFSQNLDDLKQIDWKILQGRDFSRDTDDLDKSSRYQAEALVHKYMPVSSLMGVACCDDEQREWVEGVVKKQKLGLQAVTKKGWYF
jgi:hypothetical protein